MSCDTTYMGPGVTRAPETLVSAILVGRLGV